MHWIRDRPHPVPCMKTTYGVHDWSFCVWLRLWNDKQACVEPAFFDEKIRKGAKAS